MTLKNRKCFWFLVTLLLLLTILIPSSVTGEADITEEVLLDEELSADSGSGDPESVLPESEPAEPAARDAFIEDIIALGKDLFDKADGKLQRAHYKGDIYVCKNFTVYLFRQTRSRYRMAEFPDTELKIPNNLPEKKCRPYAYGYCWEDIAASEGNPFEVAAQFLYDKKLSKDENIALAREFMKQTRKGDYFQMTGDYSGGKGAHSAIFMSDYDPETDTVRSLESNRSGKRINGLRYGKVMYDCELSIDEWIGFFCRKKCGATLYRLRDDIIFAGE